MKYDLYFETDESGMGYGESIETWKKESVVPRVGDSVFMEKGGWKNVVHVGFSTIDKKSKRRTVSISVK